MAQYVEAMTLEQRRMSAGRCAPDAYNRIPLLSLSLMNPTAPLKLYTVTNRVSATANGAESWLLAAHYDHRRLDVV